MRGRDCSTSHASTHGCARRLLCAGALLIAVVPGAHAQAVRDSLWTTDGAVNALAHSGATLFVGGSFQRVGPRTGGAGEVDRATGLMVPPRLGVQGQVLAAVADGAGGWFIGGTFSAVLGQPRANLAHVLANGTLAAWDPGTNGAVRALALDNGIVRAGGDFTSAGGEVRTRLAAFDANTGSVTAWAPSVNNSVLALLVDGGRVIAAGEFRIANGMAAASVAMFDAVTGALGPAVLSGPAGYESGGYVGSMPAIGPFGPPLYALERAGNSLFVGGNFSGLFGPPSKGLVSLDRANGSVRIPPFTVLGTVCATTSDGAGGWYLGGAFTSVQGQPRANLAHVLADGTVGAWAPGANDTVRALLRVGNTVYAGGRFTQCGGQARVRLAALDATTGILLPWTPDADGDVRAFAVNGSTLYVGGSFTRIAGMFRDGLAAFDTGTHTPIASQPWGAQHDVRALAVGPDRLYVGGGFARIGPAVGAAADIDATTGVVKSPYSETDGSVHATCPDGAGGWYLAGAFTTVRGQPRTNLAHLLADGSLAAWAPSVPGYIRSLALSGSTLFVGGLFTTAEGQARRNAAAYDVATGTLLGWNPLLGASGEVYALATLGDTVFLGGTFPTVAAQSRTGLASVHAASAAVTTWNPAPRNSGLSGNVRAMLVHGGRVYVQGTFNVIGGETRIGLASLDPVSGAVSAWNPNSFSPNAAALAAIGARIYVGGDFSNIGLQPRMRLAAVDTATGALDLGFFPDPDQTVHSLAVSGGALVAGGDFQSIGGQSRARLAAVDAASGAATAWNPDPDGTVRSVSAAGGRVFAGGDFRIFGGLARNHLAALTLTSGVGFFYNPDVDGDVESIVVSGTIAWFGGSFSMVSGLSRKNAAAYDANLGIRTWNPTMSGTVRCLGLGGSTMYLGGDFQAANNFTAARPYVAEVNLTNGLVTAWAPKPDGVARVLAVGPDAVLVGGSFTAVGAVNRNSLADQDLTTGIPGGTSWPTIFGSVRALLVRGNTLHIGGTFAGVGASSRQGLAALDITTHALQAWTNPVSSGGTVYSLAATGDTIFVGGSFTTVGGVSRANVAALQASTAQLLDWTSNPDGAVQVIRVQDGRLFLGGSFNSAAMVPRANLAAFDARTGEVRPWSPAPNGRVGSLLLAGHRLVVGGQFTYFLDLQVRQRLAALDTTTALPLWPDLELDSEPYALALDGETLYVGGSFRFLGTTSRDRLFALDIANGAILPWNPGANHFVHSLALGNGTLYAGGSFTTIAGVPRERLAAFDVGSGGVLPWSPGANLDVTALRLAGDRLYAGGSFSVIGGQARSNLAALHRVTGVVDGWSPTPPPSGTVRAIEPELGMVFVGHDGFTSGFAAYGAGSGTSVSGLPTVNQGVKAILAFDGTLYMGGTFTQFGPVSRRGLGAIADPAFAPPVDVPPRPVAGFRLADVLPNPIVGVGRIAFSLPEAGAVRLRLFDAAGRVVRTMLDGASLSQGGHESPLDVRGLAPGLYWCRLDWSGRSLARRVVALP